MNASVRHVDDDVDVHVDVCECGCVCVWYVYVHVMCMCLCMMRMCMHWFVCSCITCHVHQERLSRELSTFFNGTLPRERNVVVDVASITKDENGLQKLAVSCAACAWYG